MARALAAIGVAAIVGGGAAIGYAATRKAQAGMTPTQTAAMTRAVDQLDSEIHAKHAAVKARAESFASVRQVRLASIADPTTAADMVRGGGDELKFTTQPGEVIELGQIVKATGKAQSLVIQPDGAAPRSHNGAPGSYAELIGDQIVLTEVARVEPVPNYEPERAAQFAGFLSVSQPLAIAPAVKSLAEVGIAGKLVLGAGELAIGTMPAGAATHEQALPAQAGAKLIVAEPAASAGMPLPILVAGAVAAAAGLLLLVLGMRKRAAAEPARQAFNAMATVPTRPPATTGIGRADTQYSQPAVAASGTPSSVDPSASLSIVPQNLGPGAMIGRWEVVRRLGSGGMADVYLARASGDGGFEKLVAIKVMHSHLARNQRAVDLFLDEARLAARIQHPNVVQIQDLGKIGADYVIVMELVDGVDLERLLMSARQGERRVPLPVALGILCRISDGLDAAHNATAPDGSPLGIVHRDVKSANVLVSRQGSVKVVDFGIAKAASQVHFTVAGETKGTPSMMAPEQRVGEQVDVRADVYSLAAVGFELVTGKAVNLDLAALAHLGIENWPHLPLPSSLAAGVPPELDEILLGAMAFERERRPANCAAFEAAIAAVIKAHGLTASDKDIARWVEGELRLLSPALGGTAPALSNSPAV
ncbi:MAG TPA: serine/threonine-protein kinase [Kofleriaceae bacterium]|nr:serine/threonine-protein kinase [Kofleriaceae bacterium]